MVCEALDLNGLMSYSTYKFLKLSLGINYIGFDISMSLTEFKAKTHCKGNKNIQNNNNKCHSLECCLLFACVWFNGCKGIDGEKMKHYSQN